MIGNNDKPVAIGPTSKTVIGADDSPSVASLLGQTSPLKKPKRDWKKLALPVGMIGLAVWLTMRYKGHA